MTRAISIAAALAVATGCGSPDGGGAGRGDGGPGTGSDDGAIATTDGAIIDPQVQPEDTVLVRPDADGPVLGTVTGYEMSSGCPFADPARCELPIYSSYNRDQPEWWDVLVDELLASRIDVVMAHGRGCYDPVSGDSGNGNMCPRLLRHLVAAIERAGASDAIRLGMFDDTGAYQGARNSVDNLPGDTRFDLADRSSWRFFWDHNIQIWFDTVPKELWYRMNGRPVIAFWTLSSFFFSNQQGNARALLADLRSKFQARYGETPLFIVDTTWISEDTSITTADTDGVHNWFDPPGHHFSYRQWGGKRWGTTVPAFRDPDNLAGCGAACREVTRRNADALDDALEAGDNAAFILLEGWTDIAESAGYYRSHAWSYPNQYIATVRRHADPEPATLRLQAESADRFSDATADNIGGQYRNEALDIGVNAGTPGDWFVGWTDADEWIEFAQLELGCGTYRLTARVATDAPDRTLRVELGGERIGGATIPSTGGWEQFGLVHLGQVDIPRGRGDLRIVFETGLVNLDWLFIRRVSRCN